MVSVINRTVAGALHQLRLLRQELACMEGEKEVWRRKALALEFQLHLLQEQLAEGEQQHGTSEKERYQDHECERRG